MTAPQMWTDADEQTLRDLHATGMTLTAIAKQMGRSKNTISKYAERLGLSWDRTRTAAATEARKIDAAARRVALEERYLVEADRLLDQLREQAVVYSFGGAENTYNEHTLAKPTYADQRNIMQASSIATTAANRLRDLSVDTDASAVDQWADHILGGGEQA
jgi:hypothetical protein